MPPRGGAVAIVGADAMGKANDKEVSGDAEEACTRLYEKHNAHYSSFSVSLPPLQLKC